MAGWITKQDATICCLQETNLSSKEKHRLKAKGWKMILQGNGSPKKVGVAILTSDKIHLKPKKVTRDKHRQYIMIKGTIHQEDITVINIYVSNIGIPKHIKKCLIDLKGEIDSNTKIVEDFNTPFTSMDRLSRQKVNRELSQGQTICWDTKQVSVSLRRLKSY